MYQIPACTTKELLCFLIGRRRKASVIGWSMWPQLKPNDQLLYMPGRLPIIGEVAIVQIGSMRVIKRVTAIVQNRYCLQGDNRHQSTDYNDIVVTQIVGTVTGCLSK